MTGSAMPEARLIVTRRDDSASGSHLSNVQSHYFLRAEHTGNAFSLTEAVFQPGAQGTPLHVHTREEETYYVIEGHLEARVGDETIVLGPGGSVLLPRNIPHQVRPVGDQVTRALMIVTPPGLETMLMQLDRAKPGQLDMEALLKLSEDYGVRIMSE